MVELNRKARRVCMMRVCRDLLKKCIGLLEKSIGLLKKVVGSEDAISTQLDEQTTAPIEDKRTCPEKVEESLAESRTTEPTCAESQQPSLRTEPDSESQIASQNDVDSNPVSWSSTLAELKGQMDKLLAEFNGKLNFEEVRCFSASAFGHMPDTKEKYIPQRIDLPIRWIIKMANKRRKKSKLKKLLKQFFSLE